jgi:hypothetical protein
MPAEGAFGCTSDNQKTGMAFNKELSGKTLAAIKNPGQTIVIFEADAPPALNLNQKYVPLSEASSPKIFNAPRGWFTINADGDVNVGRSRFEQSMNGAPRVTPNSGPIQIKTTATTGN